MSPLDDHSPPPQTPASRKLEDLLAVWYALRYDRAITVEFLLVWLASIAVPNLLTLIPVLAFHAFVVLKLVWDRISILRLPPRRLAESLLAASIQLKNTERLEPHGWEGLRAIVLKNTSPTTIVRDPLFVAAGGMVILGIVIAFRGFVPWFTTGMFLLLGAVFAYLGLMMLAMATFRRVRRHLRWLVVDHLCAACGYPQVTDKEEGITVAACPECGTRAIAG